MSLAEEIRSDSQAQSVIHNDNYSTPVFPSLSGDPAPLHSLVNSIQGTAVIRDSNSTCEPQTHAEPEHCETSDTDNTLNEEDETDMNYVPFYITNNTSPFFNIRLMKRAHTHYSQIRSWHHLNQPISIIQKDYEYTVGDIVFVKWSETGEDVRLDGMAEIAEIRDLSDKTSLLRVFWFYHLSDLELQQDGLDVRMVRSTHMDIVASQHLVRSLTEEERSTILNGKIVGMHDGRWILNDVHFPDVSWSVVPLQVQGGHKLRQKLSA